VSTSRSKMREEGERKEMRGDTRGYEKIKEKRGG
jgi:hypothetical protein